MIDKTNNLSQLSLDFQHRCEMGRDNFMVSSCNRDAFKFVDLWPAWPESGLVIYGPKGCGKSHLAHLFADKVKASADKPIAVKVIDAAAVNLRNVKRLAEENMAIVVENVEQKNNNEALFHLFNLFNVRGKYMLWTAEKSPNHIGFPLRDLQTRINMLPCVAISEPDDMMLNMLIIKLFADRQIKISPDVVNYMVNNAPRSFAYIEELVEEIDKISLAYKSAVNYIIVRKAMEFLQFKNDREPDLFADF